MRGRYLHVVLSIVLVVIVAIGGGTTVVAVRACSEPVDISGTGQAGWLPDVLRRVKESDQVAYPAHVVVGDLLQLFSCQPTAIGVQWLKAGAHAWTEGQVEQVARGLGAARDKAKSPDEFLRVLCTMLNGHFARPQQEEAMANAGLSCDA